MVSDVETQHKSSSSLRYSRVSVDEMDVERMFDLTDDQHGAWRMGDRRQTDRHAARLAALGRRVIHE